MSYMEPLFGVPKIMGSPDKNDSLLAAFSFKIVLDVIMTITVLLLSASHE